MLVYDHECCRWHMCCPNATIVLFRLLWVSLCTGSKTSGCFMGFSPGGTHPLTLRVCRLPLPLGAMSSQLGLPVRILMRYSWHFIFPHMQNFSTRLFISTHVVVQLMYTFLSLVKQQRLLCIFRDASACYSVCSWCVMAGIQAELWNRARAELPQQ